MEKRQFFYTRGGKLLQGFLCLLAFGIFIACMMLVICGYEFYGADIVTNPEKSYYETESFQENLLTQISAVADHLLYMPSEMIKKNQFSVIDVEQKELYVYDLEELYNYFSDEEIYSDDLSYYDNFRKDYENMNHLDLSDYKKARKLFEDEKYKDSYIFFSNTAFKGLFLDQGIKNINYRFSPDFSEDAYFIFDYQGKTNDAEKTLEKIKKCDREDSVGEKYDLSDIDYAVYDGNVYYSTFDDYFESYTCYVYRMKDVKESLDETDPDQTRYDSIIFGLLKAENLNDTWIEDPYYAYANVSAARHELDGEYGLNSTGNFYFSYEDGIVECSEESLKDSIADDMSVADMEQQVEEYLADRNCAYYSFRLPVNGDMQYDTNSHPFDYVDELASRMKSYETPEELLIVYGFYTGAHTPSGVGVVDYASHYRFFAKYIRVIIVLGIFALIATIAFAISLICVTGRTAKKSPEVSLNFYDKLYGELWWAITIFVLGITASGEISIFNVMLRDLTVGTMVLFTSLCVIFAFLVMLFVLSLCRRIKGRLIFRKCLCGRFVKWLWRRGKEGIISAKNNTFKKIKGSKRLILFYVIFSIINIVLVFICYDSISMSGLMFICFLLLQVIGLIAVIFLVKDTNRLILGVDELVKGNLDYKIKTDEKIGIYKELANNMNHIGDGLKIAVETSLKDERMKTELITNVSHDLKTPLTSIINYIELLKKEEIESEDAKHYIEVLDGKAQRLKHLTEDLVEAAKATSGNIELNMMVIDFNELMSQALGEFEERFKEKELELIAGQPEEPVRIMADGRRLYRVLENVLQKGGGGAMPKTRVYIELLKQQEKAVFTIKNVSQAPLNISSEELMERFTRGDESRTTEGSGLGLSIAKDLTALQNGKFDIILDGDLFKVVIEFKLEQ